MARRSAKKSRGGKPTSHNKLQTEVHRTVLEQQRDHDEKDQAREVLMEEEKTSGKLASQNEHTEHHHMVQELQRALDEKDRVHKAVIDEMSKKHEKVVAEKVQENQQLLQEMALATPLAILGIASRERCFSTHAYAFHKASQKYYPPDVYNTIRDWDNAARRAGNYTSHAGEFPVEDAIIFESLWRPRSNGPVAAYSGAILSQIEERASASHPDYQMQPWSYPFDLPSRDASLTRYKIMYGVSPDFVLAHKHIPKIMAIIKRHGYYFVTEADEHRYWRVLSEEAGKRMGEPSTTTEGRAEDLIRLLNEQWQVGKKSFMNKFRENFLKTIVERYNETAFHSKDGQLSMGSAQEDCDSLPGFQELYLEATHMVGRPGEV